GAASRWPPHRAILRRMTALVRQTLFAGAMFAGVAASGCSLVFTTRAPDHPERIPPAMPIMCTTSRAAPVVDTIIAGLESVRTIFAVSAKDSVYQGATITRPADIGIGLGLTTLFAVSAIYGFSVTSGCDEAKQTRARQIPPGPYAYPPTPYAYPP